MRHQRHNESDQDRFLEKQGRAQNRTGSSRMERHERRDESRRDRQWGDSERNERRKEHRR